MRDAAPEARSIKIAPVISSSVAGPLGILHLPRLWLKLVLHALGKLPEGYRAGSGGFDDRLGEYFGIERDALVAYVTQELPQYGDLERWIVANARDLRQSSPTPSRSTISMIGRRCPRS